MVTKSYAKPKLNDKGEKNDNFTFELGGEAVEEAIIDFADVLNGRVDNKMMEETESQGTSMNSDNDIVTSPLNQILYGPPGTGKTYHSIDAAVKAAEPQYYASLKIDIITGTTDKQREELTNKYKELSDAGRIRFVTFHQSYGYEEFVEGISAKTEQGQVSYKIKSGVFKQIAEDASLSKVNLSHEINPDGQVWKISINGVHANPQKKYCFENDLAAIGWGDTGDLSVRKRNDYFNKLVSHDRNSITSFSESMEIGDLILCINSNSSIEAIGVVSGEYFYNEDGLLGRPDFKHFLPVKWLKQGINIDFKSLNGNRTFHTPTCNHLKRLTITAVLNHLIEHQVTIGIDELKKPVENYVLIIDEINRGNISKIFGELITLIEPSKRKGNREALDLILPCSSTPFSVPNNLHIIGTMNTADRSLAMMDTALRRRFDFIEMMPNTSLFSDTDMIKGIDLEALLETMNKRIEVLYDREHTLGHAFFMPVKALVDKKDESGAFQELQSVFKNKIIPLLEEYFFEDWNKIRLVLGDNRKAESLRFVTEEKQSYDEIFGAGHGLDSYETESISYTLASFDGEESVWGKAAAYIGIYSSKPVEVNKSDSESEAA
ncbi:AAA family ATPase [Moritella sp. 5]|nr:AAA family ATPase [Moritella sp. 5]